MSDVRVGVAFIGSTILLREVAGVLRLPHIGELAEALGEDDLQAARVPVDVRGPDGTSLPSFSLPSDVEIPNGFRADGLRVAYHALPEEDFRAAGTARQKVEWYETHRFCSRCASPTRLHPSHQAMECLSCGQLHFPRVAPAVIVLVQRGREVLLARSPHFNEGIYSTLAGFVEAGESLEECAHREIAEEVGVRVTNLRYFGSQPHPFPHSLMVGFLADWLDGEIQTDGVEIEDAAWFTPEFLPGLPHPMSIARALIEDFIARTPH